MSQVRTKVKAGVLSTPVLRVCSGLLGFVVTIVFYFFRERWAFKPEEFMDNWGAFLVFALVALFLFGLDFYLAARESRMINRLYEFVGDVGQLASTGHGIESAVHHTAQSRPGQAANLFGRALRNQDKEDFSQAIVDEGAMDGRKRIVQVTQFVGIALKSGGEVGRMLSSLSSRLASIRKVEREFEANLNGKVMMLRFLSNGLFPLLFGAVATQQGYTSGYKWGAMFYLSISLRILTIDRLRLRSWFRSFSMQPLWIVVTVLCLQLGYYLMKDNVYDYSGHGGVSQKIENSKSQTKKIKLKKRRRR